MKTKPCSAGRFSAHSASFGRILRYSGALDGSPDLYNPYLYRLAYSRLAYSRLTYATRGGENEAYLALMAAGVPYVDSCRLSTLWR